MKKLLPLLIIAILALTASPVVANTTAVQSTSSQNAATLSQEQANSMVKRIYEIREISKKDLNATEKNNLRNELKDIKAKLAGPVTGVYISGAALILLIVLLIILL